MAQRSSGRSAEQEPAAPDVASMTYADASGELDAIIGEFETGVVDVDRLVAQLERATDIVDELDRRLRRTRIQVEELVPRLEAIGGAEAADGDDEDEPRADAAEGDGASPGLF
jgi:exonuclease VII small subunit